MPDKSIQHNKEIRFKLDLISYNQVKQKADNNRLDLNKYCILKVTDDVAGVEELKRTIIRMLPEYYNRIKGIGNTELRQYFKNFGALLWQL